MTEEADSTEKPAARPVRVLDAGALRALAHPLRVEIFDILSQFGPQTASSLAERLGESSGATSYHLRALAGHDLIREVEGKGTGRERWWERPRGSVTITSPEVVKTPAGRAATQIVVAEFYRRYNDQLMNYLNTSMRGPQEEDWSAMLSTASTSLTTEQFDDLSARIQALIDEAVDKYRDQTGEGVRRFSIRTDIFPISPEGEPS